MLDSRPAVPGSLKDIHGKGRETYLENKSRESGDGSVHEEQRKARSGKRQRGFESQNDKKMKGHYEGSST